MEDVLIEPGEEEGAIAPDGPAERHPELVLLAAGLHIQHRTAGVETAVAEIVEPGAMELVRSRFCDYIHHRATRAPGFGRRRILRYPELLNDLIRELIGRAISPARLSEERVVVVASVHQIAGLKTSNA